MRMRHVRAAGAALELGQQHHVHGDVVPTQSVTKTQCGKRGQVHGGDLLDGQLVRQDAADEVGQVAAAAKTQRIRGKRNCLKNKSKWAEALPEPVDEEYDAQAFAGLVLVVDVELRQLGDEPAAYAQHSE